MNYKSHNKIYRIHQKPTSKMVFYWTWHSAFITITSMDTEHPYQWLCKWALPRAETPKHTISNTWENHTLVCKKR